MEGCRITVGISRASRLAKFDSFFVDQVRKKEPPLLLGRGTVDPVDQTGHKIGPLSF